MRTLVVMVLFVAGCASRGPGGSKESSIEIAYVRGHTSHRFVANDEQASARLKSFVDRQLLRDVKIAHGKYEELAGKTLDLLETLERNPASKPLTPCRTPFSVRLKGREVRTVEGCRSADEAVGLGKLIKDFEFAMVSVP